MRVMIIGDTHFPAVHPKYLAFLRKVHKKYKINRVVHIGDVVDWHSVSLHDKHPDCPLSLIEYERACELLEEYAKVFPKVDVCIGNHDQRLYKLATTTGIHPSLVKGPEELWPMCPHWKWKVNHVIDEVIYNHGTNYSGKSPAFNAAISQGVSVVSGHTHTVAAIGSSNSGLRPQCIFGMNVGCGVDIAHPSMFFGANKLKQPILSCGVVIDGHPYLEYMK